MGSCTKPGKGDSRRPTDENKVADNWPAGMGPKGDKVQRFRKVYGAPAAAQAIQPDMTYVKYVHHGVEVAVREDLKGTHRKHCLCFSCAKFKPSVREDNCPIANDTFMNCVKHGITTPVFECPQFVEGAPDVT